MDALHLRKFSRLLTAWTAAVAVSLCATAAAQAQTVPAPAPDVPVTAAAPDQTAPATAPVPAPAPAVAVPAKPDAMAPTGVVPAPPGPVIAQAKPAPKPAPTPAWFLPIIDFVVTFTQPAYYVNMSQLPAYDPVDLGGTVRFQISPKLNLYFDRITEGTINQPLDRVLQGGATVLSKDTRDILLQYHGTWTFNRFLSMDVGDSFRHRVFSSGAGTPPLTGFPLNTNISAQPFPYTLSSTEHHYGYLGFTYTTKPMKELMNSVFVFNVTGEAQNVDHKVAMLCSGANIAALPTNTCASSGLAANQVGLFDERPGTTRYITSTQGVSWIWPIDPKHGTTFLMNERFGYLNWYENAFFPYRWNSALVYQLSKRFSPGFTLAVRHQDLHQTPQGAPFAFPNAIHVGSWDVIGTFHLDTNSWFPH